MTDPTVAPVDVACPDCAVPAGTACRFGSRTHIPEAVEQPVHANRARAAHLRSLPRGTCRLCGRPLVQGPPDPAGWHLAPVDAEPITWHPDPADAAACPPIPDPATDWDGYAAAIQAGAVPGRVAFDDFIPSEPGRG